MPADIPLSWQRGDVAALLGDLVVIDSVNPSLVPGAAGEDAIARWVGEWLQTAGLSVELPEVAPGRPNVIAHLPGAPGGRVLLLNAHLDTVGVTGMTDPFQPRIEGHRLYGRGAYDMKAGLAAVMLAAAALARLPNRAGSLIVTGVADEEYASLGTQAVAASLRADAAIVTEPTALRLCTAHRGFAWLEVDTHGRAAHGSKPDLGVDAIVHMGRVLTELEAETARLTAQTPHPLLGHASIHASLIQGGQELSSYPAFCRLQVERRTLPGETVESVVSEMNALLQRAGAGLPAFQAETRLLLWRDPFEVEQGAEIVRTVASAAADALGAVPEVYGDSPWMDAALLHAAGIPTVVFGPGGAGAHAVEEWADLDQTAACAAILARTALTFWG